MASRRARAYKKRRKKKGSPNSNKAVDRLSALPDELIHQILAFIPTIKVVQLSLLSRRWRHVWLSVPSLHLAERGTPFVIMKRVGFNMFAEECLKRRLEESLRLDSASTVTRFHLDIDSSLSPGMAGAMTRLLRSRKSINKIKVLNLICHYCWSSLYCLPAELLNSTSLRVIDLSNVRLPVGLNCFVNLPSLTSLHLEFVSMCDGILTQLLSGCPSLQTLRLIQCSGLRNPNFCSSSLESLIFYSRRECKEIRIEAVNLKTLKLNLEDALLDISSCEAVRDLELRNCVVDDKLLSDIEYKFTRLESLTLTTCSTLDEITICSRSLKKCTICKRDDAKLEAIFETPNLEAFEYKGDFKFGMSMNSLNDQLNAKISVQAKKKENFYLRLFKFASGFCWSNNDRLTLDLRSDEVYLNALLFMKDSNSHPMWPDPKHIEVNCCALRRRISKLKSAMKLLLHAKERNRYLATPLSQAIHKILNDQHNRFSVKD